jgi:putative spermidine/putrescine transport system permease protein
MTAKLVRAALVAVVALPLLVLGLGAVSIRWFFPQVLPAEWDLAPAQRLIEASSTVEAARTGIVVATVVTVLALVVAWPAARVLARPSLPHRGIALAVLFLPSIVPAVGLAMGLNVGLLSLDAAGTPSAVVAAHLVPAVPYTVATLLAAFTRHDQRMEHQAASLGANPRQVLVRVTIPAMRRGIAAAAALTFLVSWSQYLLTLLAGSGEVITLTMLLFNAVAGGNPTTIGTLALLTVLPAAVLVGVAVLPAHAPEEAP